MCWCGYTPDSVSQQLTLPFLFVSSKSNFLFLGGTSSSLSLMTTTPPLPPPGIKLQAFHPGLFGETRPPLVETLRSRCFQIFLRFTLYEKSPFLLLDVSCKSFHHSSCKACRRSSWGYPVDPV